MPSPQLHLRSGDLKRPTDLPARLNDQPSLKSIRDRVANWQIICNEALSSSEEGLLSPDQGRKANESLTQKETKGRLRSQTNVEHEPSRIPPTTPMKLLDDDERNLRAQSTPRKRVISDEHWVKERQPRPAKPNAWVRPHIDRQPHAQQEQTKEEPTRIEHGFSVEPGGGAWVRKRLSPDKTLNGKDASPFMTLNLAKPRLPAGQESPNVPISKDDKPERRSRDADVASSNDVLPKASQAPSGPSSEESKLKRTSKEKQEHEPLLTSLPSAEQGDGQKSPARKLPSRPKAFIRQRGKPRETDEAIDEGSEPSKIATGRIADWLGSTPDPFVDNTGRLPTDPMQSPFYPESDFSGSPRKLHEYRSIEDERDRRTRRKERRPRSPLTYDADGRVLYAKITKARNLDAENAAASESTDTSLNQTPTLKRRGARKTSHSPKKQYAAESIASVQQYSHQNHAAEEADLSEVAVHQGLDANVAAVELSHRFQRVKDDENDVVLWNSTSRNSSQNRGISIVDDAKAQDGPTTQNNLKPPGYTWERFGSKKKLTSHADLMSVLSGPEEQVSKLQSACTIRRKKSKLRHLSIEDTLSELRSEESKYMRELRTLIDGVVPVLLTCVLSKDKGATASTLWTGKGNGVSATTSIVNMGVALERLKSSHKRLAITSAESTLVWSAGAHKVYSDYLKSWRLGFEDVVVNLATADGKKPDQPATDLNSGLDRNDDGDVVDDSGERIDVAHLLKRPLVRIRHLAKALKSIATFVDTEQAHLWASRYQDLVAEARSRQKDEQARLEDEAAANIDVSRVRDLRTLAPIPGVVINPEKSVRARDFFDMRLCHSSGQQLDCRIEIILREELEECSSGNSGEILICEVDSTARWLLLPPIELNRVSARLGTVEEGFVVMIRDGDNKIRRQELLSLRYEEEQTGEEWLQMLGTEPCPPKFSFDADNSHLADDRLDPFSKPVDAPETLAPEAVQKAHESEVPFGERSRPSVKTGEVERDASDENVILWNSTKASQSTLSLRPKSMSSLSKPDTQASSAKPHALPLTNSALNITGKSTNLPVRTPPSPSNLNDAMSRAGEYTKPWDKSVIGDTIQGNINLRRERSSQYSDSQRESIHFGAREHETSHSMYNRLLPDSHSQQQNDNNLETSQPMRKGDNSSLQTATPMHGDKYWNYKQSPASNTQIKGNIISRNDAKEDIVETNHLFDNASSRVSDTHDFTSTKRRSSSPLKHEYAPSSLSEDSIKAELLSDNDKDSDVDSFTSDSSVDDVVPSLPPISAFKKGGRPHPLPPIPSALPGVPQEAGPQTLAPSDSASQAPYRTVIPSNGVDDENTRKQIASIFCWSERGGWEKLHADECSVVVSPGLIEAFDLVQAHINAQRMKHVTSPAEPERLMPLIALELTPLVPLRRSTAIDISVRSPPTAHSQLKPSTNNIMFRSRSNMECENLYNLINQSRINNPTYIALQNARPAGGPNWSAFMDGRDGARKRWWHLGRKRSYRGGSSRRSGSLVERTEDIEDSMSKASAFSALKRFSNGSKIFDVAKSTVTGMSPNGASNPPGTRSSTTLTSKSSADGVHSGNSTPASGVRSASFGSIDPGTMSTPQGISNTKIRLYVRELSGGGGGRAWRDLGAARLAVLQPPRPPGQPPQLAPDGSLVQEKRVLVRGQTRGEVLLDVTAGESAFERVGRVGIAVRVWQQQTGVAKWGGVTESRVTVYMVQFRGEAEAAYVFGCVGRLRY